MATKRAVKAWTKDELKTLTQLVKEGIPTAKIAKQLKRSAASIRSKAQKGALSLKAKLAKKPAAKKAAKK